MLPLMARNQTYCRRQFQEHNMFPTNCSLVWTGLRELSGFRVAVVLHNDLHSDIENRFTQLEYCIYNMIQFNINI